MKQNMDNVANKQNRNIQKTMLLHERLKADGDFCFRYRSYLPLVLLPLLFLTVFLSLDKNSPQNMDTMNPIGFGQRWIMCIGTSRSSSLASYLALRVNLCECLSQGMRQRTHRDATPKRNRRNPSTPQVRIASAAIPCILGIF